MKRLLSALLSVVMMAGLSHAASLKETWWDTHEQGWFWYIDPEPEPEPEKAPEPSPSPAQPPPAAVPPEQDGLTAEDLRTTGEVLMGKAIANPTFENVKRYVAYQKRMMDLAQRFGVVWQQVIMKHPELVVDTDAEGKTRKALASLKDRAGILFIYRATSEVSQAMAAIVDTVRIQHGLSVLAVTLDEKALPQFPDTRLDNGISVSLNVTTEPTLFLLFPKDNRVEKLGEGFIHQYDLEQRIARFGQNDETPLELLQAELLSIIKQNKQQKLALTKDDSGKGGQGMMPFLGF